MGEEKDPFYGRRKGSFLWAKKRILFVWEDPMYKIADQKSLYRDPHSKAVINTSQDDLENYRKRKAAEEERKRILFSLEERVSKMEETLEKIVNLLKK